MTHPISDRGLSRDRRTGRDARLTVSERRFFSSGRRFRTGRTVALACCNSPRDEKYSPVYTPHPHPEPDQNERECPRQLRGAARRGTARLDTGTRPHRHCCEHAGRQAGENSKVRATRTTTVAGRPCPRPPPCAVRQSATDTGSAPTSCTSCASRALPPASPPAPPAVLSLPPPRTAQQSLTLQASRTVVFRALRASSSRPLARSARALSTTRVVREEAAAAAAAEVSPKISSIVDSVEKLTLLEVSELVSALKVRPIGLWRVVA